MTEREQIVAWLPIESAPKDGTRIIVAHIGWCYSNDRFKELVFSDAPRNEYRVFWVSQARFDAKRDKWTDGLDSLVPPTHWQPLITPQPDAGPNGCAIPPAGWYCTRKACHDGPCAAIETADAIERGDFIKDKNDG